MIDTIDITAAREVCQRFASAHKIIFEDDGSVGFGRPCVGFIRGNGYVEYNPYAYPDHTPVWPADSRLSPPTSVSDAYHKANCLAVLVHEDDSDAAIIQLARWVRHLESHGDVVIEEYATGATGMQALFSGVIGYAVRIREARDAPA